MTILAQLYYNLSFETRFYRPSTPRFSFWEDITVLWRFSTRLNSSSKLHLAYCLLAWRNWIVYFAFVLMHETSPRFVSVLDLTPDRTTAESRHENETKWVFRIDYPINYSYSCDYDMSEIAEIGLYQSDIPFLPLWLSGLQSDWTSALLRHK